MSAHHQYIPLVKNPLKHSQKNLDKNSQFGNCFLSFSKQVLEENYNPEKIRNSGDVAKLLSTKKFGLSDKTEMLVLNNSNEVVGKFVLPESNQYPKIVELLTQYGGVNAILYGNNINPNTINDYNKKLKSVNFSIIDGVNIKSNNYKSLADEGLINEGGSGYNRNSKNVVENKSGGINVLITPATVRSFDAETKRLQTLTNEYGKVAHEIANGDLTNAAKFVQLQDAILNSYQEEIEKKVADIRGVEVEFNAPYIGSWQGSYEPSLNMRVKIDESADTGALSGLLFDIAENTSQDAFILEEESEISDRVPLTEVDDNGYTHYPQVRVTFERDLTVAEKSEVAQRLKRSGIDSFSVDGNYFIVSIIDFNEYETHDARKMGYAKAYSSITTPFRGVREGVGANRVRSIQRDIRKSRIIRARNEGDEQSPKRQ